MDTRINKIAALANLSAYDEDGSSSYIDGAPHIKHRSLRILYGQLVIQVFDRARKYNKIPIVLDLGAGEGSVTLPFLELGAKVVAVDSSASQLKTLQSKCERFGDMLEIRCEDVHEILKNKQVKYDIVVANSFLHHVPDYLTMIKEATTILNPHGQFFSFQDPLRYDSLGKFTMLFSTLVYFWWRGFRGDLIGGVKRRIRRARGIYLEGSVHDNAEYHVTRNGVDQVAICRLLDESGFDCEILPYFSAHSYIFQPIGAALNLKNTFGVIAQVRANRQE